MSLLPKKLLSIFKPTNESTTQQSKNYEEDNNDVENNPDGIDIIALLWERNMAMIIRHIFKSVIEPGHVGIYRQVCKLWNSIIEQEILPHLNHRHIAQTWMHGQITVTDLDYLKHLGDASYEEVIVYMIVPLEWFTFIVLTRNQAEYVLMVYELEQFKACVNLPLNEINIERTVIKLGKDTVNIIIGKQMDKSRGYFSVTMISLDNYQIIGRNLSFRSMCSSLHHMQAMKTTTWIDFTFDGFDSNLDINVLTNTDPFNDVIKTIPGVVAYAKPNEKITDMTFHNYITKTKKPTYMAMRTSRDHSLYRPVRLVNLLSQKVEDISKKKDVMKFHYPLIDTYFLTERHFIYAIWDRFYTTITLTIKRLSDGSEIKINPLKPQLKSLIGSLEWREPMNVSFCGTVPGSNVAMLCLEMAGGHGLCQETASDISLSPHGFGVYFIDLERGLLIGGEDAGMFINTDPVTPFKMLTPSMFLVGACGFGRQRCFVFRMSDDEEVHKDGRDITQGVAEAIGGIPDGSRLRVHFEHHDPRSSPQIYDGTDHLIFSLEDTEVPNCMYEYTAKKQRCYSKIYFVKFS